MSNFDWCTLFLDDPAGKIAPSIRFREAYAPMAWIVKPETSDIGTSPLVSARRLRSQAASDDALRIRPGPVVCQVKHCAGLDPGCPLVVCTDHDLSRIGVLWHTIHATSDDELVRLRQFCSSMQLRPALSISQRVSECVALMPEVAAGVLFRCSGGVRLMQSSDVLKVYDTWDELETDPVAVSAAAPMPDGSTLPALSINAAELALTTGTEPRLPLTIHRVTKTMVLDQLDAPPLIWRRLLNFQGVRTNLHCVVAEP